MRKKKKAGKRKWRTRPETPLKPYRAEVPLSTGLMKKISHALVHTNKTFKEIGQELNLDPSIISEVCVIKNLRTPEEHREIAQQRIHEKRRETFRRRKEAQAEKGESKSKPGKKRRKK